MPIERLLTILEQSSAKDAKKACRLIASIEDSSRDASRANIAKWLDQLQKLLDNSDLPEKEQIHEWMNSRRDEFNQLLYQKRQEFGTELATCLQPLAINVTGQAPLLYAGLFTIEMIERTAKVKIWYGPKQELLGTASMDAHSVSKRIERLQQHLGSGLEPNAFIEKLDEVLRWILLSSDDRKIPIIQVLPRIALFVQDEKFLQNPLRKHYRNYGRGDFSYDLFRCSTTPLFLEYFHLVIATRMHTKRKTDYLWIPSDRLGNGSRYAYIEAKG